VQFELRFWEESLASARHSQESPASSAGVLRGRRHRDVPGLLTRKNANALKKIKEAGVDYAFWPLMEKEQGYFPGERNASSYGALVRHQVEWAQKNDVLPDTVAIDLEMPSSRCGK